MPKKFDNRTDRIKNHFVPRCYLKSFTFDGKACWVIRDANIFEQSISNIAYEKYLNTYDYEEFLGDNYESKFGKCIDQIMLERRLLVAGLHPPHYSGCWDFIFDLVSFMWSHNKYTRELIAQNISDDLNLRPEFSSVVHDIRSNDFYAREIFDSIRNDIEKWRFVIRINPDTKYGFITSDNPCQIGRIDVDLLKAINSNEFINENNLINIIKGEYNVQVQDLEKVVDGKINVHFGDDSVLMMPLTHDIYIILFKNHDTAKFVARETSFSNNDIRHGCNQFTFSNKKYECYARTKDILTIYK